MLEKTNPLPQNGLGAIYQLECTILPLKTMHCTATTLLWYKMVTPPHLDSGETLGRSSCEGSVLVQAPSLCHCPVGWSIHGIIPYAFLCIMFHKSFVKKVIQRKVGIHGITDTAEHSLRRAVLQRSPSPQWGPEANGSTSQTGPIEGAGTSVGPESWEKPPLLQRAKTGILCALLRLQTPLSGCFRASH